MVVLILARRGIKELSEVWSNLRTGKIILVLVVYSFGGAAIFHVVEIKMTTPKELAFGPGCLALFNNYWASLNYVNTLYSTMGYGSVYCCSWLGRLLTCIYILIGTPILLIVLEALGKILAKICTQMWTFGVRFVTNVKIFFKRIMTRCCCRRPQTSSISPMMEEEGKKQEAEKKGDGEDDEEEMIPLSAGLALSLVWLLSAGLYFSYIEGWPYASSLYFLWISVTTVGLGDFAPTKYEYTIINFALLFVGLSLISMCIAVLQTKIENMVKRIQRDMQRRRITGEGDGTGADDAAAEKKNNGFMGKLMKNSEEKMLKMMLTTNQRDIVTGNDKNAPKMQNARTQTKAPTTVMTVKLCDQHRHYAGLSEDDTLVNVVNDGTQRKSTNSFNQFAKIATEEIFTVSIDDQRMNTPERATSEDCIICRALEDNKPPTPPPPPPPPTPPPVVVEPPTRWRM